MSLLASISELLYLMRNHKKIVNNMISEKTFHLNFSWFLRLQTRSYRLQCNRYTDISKWYYIIHRSEQSFRIRTDTFWNQYKKEWKNIRIFLIIIIPNPTRHNWVYDEKSFVLDNRAICIVDPLKLKKNHEMVKLYQNKLKTKIVS